MSMGTDDKVRQNANSPAAAPPIRPPGKAGEKRCLSSQALHANLSVGKELIAFALACEVTADFRVH